MSLVAVVWYLNCLHFLVFNCIFALFCLVRAMNLHSVCPFSLGNVVSYGPHEQPYYRVYSPAAKQSLPAKQTVVEREPQWQSCGQARNSDSTYDGEEMFRPLAPQQKLAAQRMDAALESTQQTRLPGQLQQVFIPVSQDVIC